MDFVKIIPDLGFFDSVSLELVFFYAPLKLIVTGHHSEFIYIPSHYQSDKLL